MFLYLQINMEAVTSTDYDSTNLSRGFNQIGFSTYNYSQFEEKYKPRQNVKYSDDYHVRGSIKGPVCRTFSRYPNDTNDHLEHKHPRSHSQPEKQQQLCYENRSKSQDSRELTFYQIDATPPLKHESRHTKCHRSEKTHDGGSSIIPDKKENSKLGALDKNEKKASIKHNHVKSELKIDGSCNHQQPNKSEVVECHLGNHKQVEPPKYRQFDRPPKYQEDPPRSEPPPRYHPEPPKYCEVTKRPEEPKKSQVCKNN